MSENKIHAALAVYDPSGTYSQHAGVVITSLFEHTKSDVIVHILHDDTLTDLNRERFLKTAARYNQTVDLINVEEYKKQIDEVTLKNIPERWGIGTLYRLFIPEILSGIDRVIYLDCDIVVNMDIAELWDIDLGDNALGGANDSVAYDDFYKFTPRFINLRLKLLELEREKYINAGVLLMNLNKIRELGNFTEIVLNWLIRHAHSARAFDQDALNSIFRDSIKIIDQRFNYFHYTLEDIDLSGNIIHCICAPKPWLAFPVNKANRLYWKNLFKSEWCCAVTGGMENESPSEEQRLDVFMDKLSRFMEQGHKEPYHTRIRQGLMNIIKKISRNLLFLKAAGFSRCWDVLYHDRPSK
ncbi:MAG: glycosyltransferase family 8 protein [Synergistaceae bacterium]|nr:glycosyltransferase family 8 protein [Synergistaceae bacterium]